jgi:hypothetical protein
MGPPHGRGDWTAMAHDDAFRISDIGIGDYFDRSMPAEKSSALIRANHMLIKNAAGVQAVKMGIAFGIIDAFQLITH